MKKIIVLFVFLINLAPFAFAQPTFNKTIQLDTQTYFPSTEFYDVEEDGKFIYVLGDYRDYTPNAPSTSTSFVLTLNQSGNILHRKDFKPQATYSNLVPIGNDGFALVTSNFTDSLFLLKIYPLSDTVITIAQSLNTLPLTCSFRRLSITADKHFLVAGRINSPSPNYGIGEIYMKLDSLGNIVWQHNNMSFSPESNRATQLIELQNGHYLLIGTRRYKSYAFSDFESQGYFKILDASGVVLSTTHTDNNRLLTLDHGEELTNGDLLFAGTERHTAGLNAADIDYRGYLCKYNNTGQLLWEYSLEKDYDWLNRFIVLDDGSCIVPGVRTDTISSSTVPNTMDSIKRHGFLLKLAPDGTKLWERKFTILDSASSAERSLFSITEATNGNLLSVGKVLYFQYTSVGASVETVGWIIQTDSFGCIVPGCQLLSNTENQAFDEINQLTVYPNPTMDLITFRFEKQIENGSIRIFNSLGQEMKTQSIIDNQTPINCSNWQNGMYFYGIYENNRLVKQGQFLKQ